MIRAFLFSVCFFFIPFKSVSGTCERVAFATGQGFVIVRTFHPKEVDLVNLIDRYNPRFNLQLEKEGYSRAEFQGLIVPSNQALLFLKNFYLGNIYGRNQFFVSGLNSYFMAPSAPLIGRVIRKVSQNRAVVEVVTVSGDLRKVEVEVEAAFTFDYYNEGTKDIFADGFKVFVRGDNFEMRVRQGHPRLEMVFAALGSDKRRVDSSVVRVPPRTNEERAFKEQGFNSAYVRGLDKVNEWVSVIDQIRKLKVSPHKTHIEYFANHIEAHIEHVKRGLDPSILPALRNLERLRRHAERMVRREGVTYHWWLRFNYALSRISDLNIGDVDLIRSPSPLSRVGINNLVNRFPAYVVMPTIIEKMGVMAINRATQHDIYIGGLMSGKGTGHGKELVSPEWFFDHDISVHAIGAINVRSTYWDKNQSLRYRLLIEKIQNLSGEQRRHAELAFYILTHERGDGAFLDRRSLYIRSPMFTTLSDQILNGFNFRGLLVDAPNKEKMLEEAREVVDGFMEVVKAVKNPAEPAF